MRGGRSLIWPTAFLLVTIPISITLWTLLTLARRPVAMLESASQDRFVPYSVDVPVVPVSWGKSVASVSIPY
jgi:hypothetical protein